MPLSTLTTLNGNPYRILLVEEDPKEAEFYSELIREVATCQVDVLSRIDNSLDWVGRSNYQLVVINMPKAEPSTEAQPPARPSLEESSGVAGLGGLGVMEQIKRFSPETSVIILSDRASVEQAVAAVRLGAEDYLKKPFSPEAFQLAVKRGLDRKTVFGNDMGAASLLSLLNSCQMISATLEQEKIFGVIRSYLGRELRSPYSAIYTLNGNEPERLEVEGLAIDDVGAPQKAMLEILDIALQAANPLSGMAVANEWSRFIDRGQLTPGLFVFRFKCAGKVDYYAVCLSPVRPQSVEAFESRLKILRAQLEVTGKNIEQYLGVQHLVYVDDATGLYNTRYMNYILDREIAQAKASSKSFAVLFIDADKFKQVNDVHGHLIGTKLLNELGEQLKNLTREKDTVFRYGGDEFVAVLSPCDLTTAMTVAERIRYKIEHHEFLHSEGKNLHFTVTIGVAMFPEHASSKREIVEVADHAMFSAKRKSRNSVTLVSTLKDEGAAAPAKPPQRQPAPGAAPAKAQESPAPSGKTEGVKK